MENENVTSDVITENVETKPEKKDNSPTILCIISAVLMYGVNLVVDIAESIQSGENIFTVITARTGINLLFGLVSPLSFWIVTVGLIILIFLRVTYPKYIGGKILMWFTIAYFVGIIVNLYITIVRCGSAIDSCCRPFE